MFATSLGATNGLCKGPGIGTPLARWRPTGLEWKELRNPFHSSGLCFQTCVWESGQRGCGTDRQELLGFEGWCVLGAVLLAPRGQHQLHGAQHGAQFPSCTTPWRVRERSLPDYKICAHHLLSTYYLPRRMLGGTGSQHHREDRAVEPQCPGQVAMAASCPPNWPAGVSKPLCPPPNRGFLFVQPSSISRGLPGGWRGSDFLHQTLELLRGLDQPGAATPACLEHLGYREAPEDLRRPRRTLVTDGQ